MELSETRESARDRTMGDSKQVVAELLETELVRKGGGGSWAHDVEEFGRGGTLYRGNTVWSKGIEDTCHVTVRLRPATGNLPLNIQ